MWFARAGFPPGTRAKKNALLAPNHAQRLGAFLLAIVYFTNPKPNPGLKPGRCTMADVPLLRTVSHAHHSEDGELLDFTVQFTDGSETSFEAHETDFIAAMSVFGRCQISARKAREKKGRADPSGAPPSDAIAIDPKRLGLIVGPEGLPYLVVYRSNEPPLGIRLTVEDAQRLSGTFQRLLQKVERTPEPKRD
jgi:hypothetical protein